MCVDVMASVRRESDEMKDAVETRAVKVIKNEMTPKSNKPEESVKKLHDAVKSLREKGVVYCKADKSNNIVVMERDDYDRIALKTINEGQYVECLNDPLYDMVNDVEDTLDKHKHVLCDNPRYELRTWKVSNPEVPCLYLLIKIHKEPDADGDRKARPVASNVNAPTEKIAKKLVKIFGKLPKLSSRKLFIRFNEHVNSARWKQKTAVGRHIFITKHEINISDLKLIQPVKQHWKVEYYEAVHIHKHKHENLLNIDDGNLKSPLLNLFVLKRKVDERIIDLTEDTPNSSVSEIYYDCLFEE